MKKYFIAAGIILAIVALIVFNKISSKRGVVSDFAEVKQGEFEISVSNSGELYAEQSMDINGPELATQNQGMGGGARGGRMRVMDLEIQDIVAEGTVVKKGDYIAQLDRSSYDNTLKDEYDNLKTCQTNFNMKVLDTAVVLTNLRDEIKNQAIVVEEAEITLAQSKFEPPATIRQAEIAVDKAKRTLEQQKKTYSLKVAQSQTETRNVRLKLEQEQELIAQLQDYLAKFTITSPASGMLIYKKDRSGSKRKAGSSLNSFDLVIATLPDLSTMMSKMYVSEIEVNKIKPGQQVLINVDAIPGKLLKGSVSSVANVGEQLNNSDSKMFEVNIKLDHSDPDLRPSMTTTNKIIIQDYNNVVYIPTECVQTGSDSIPFVYSKKRTKQVVLLGESNDKNIIVEQGLKPGESIYLTTPADPEKFRLAGENLKTIIKSQR
jgi:HlyD family secretion protein